MTEEITFYSKLIYLNDQFAVLDELKDLFGDENYISLMLNKTLHTFSVSFRDNYIFLYVEYGSVLPRPEHVLNAQTNEQENNPRGVDQIEPKQLFLIIDTRTSLYWSSNNKKSNIIIDLFAHFGKRCILKNVYDSKEFINNISSINGIKLSSTPDRLFNIHSLNKNLTSDIFGYGASAATLQFSYVADRFLDKTLRKKFEELFEERSSFSTFIISGKDDLGMDYVFNSESVIKKISIGINETYNKVYNPTDVFALFLEEN